MDSPSSIWDRAKLSTCILSRLAAISISLLAVAQVNPSRNEALPSVYLPVQSKDAKALAAGKLLVASRNVGDPNFAQTVVLLIHYDAQGVAGLILNRRTDMPISRVLEDLKAAKDRTDPVYLGGPVEVPSLFALIQSPAKIEGAENIFDQVYLIPTKTLFEKIVTTRPDAHDFRIYLGYAAWTNDQLRREVELGAWFIFPAEPDAVFSARPDSLWLQMIGKTELKFANSRPADSNPSTRADPSVEVSYRNELPR